MSQDEAEALAHEIQILKGDSTQLRTDLGDLQRANARLASLLYGHKMAIQALLERITPRASAETMPASAPEGLKKAA